jgi:thiamine biosynthesis protein ThiI
MLKQEKIKTFKVKTKRSDKNFNISSVDFSKMIGSFILNNFKKLKVDVHNPELLLNIEIRQYYSYIYTNSYRGLGGYPVGTLGRGLVMLSGGIDSPVAFYLAAKRGIKLDAVYFESMPYTSLEARNKVINLCKILTNYTDNINLYIIPFTEIQEAIYKYTDNTYAITIMRRMMYRIMEKLVKKMNYQTIINGESIGQVASQTLTSLLVVNEVTNFPIIRPLACLDKLEIINISKKIGTYETSILPYEDCCTIFVPKHPVINPKLTKSKIMEEKFDYEKMINQAIEKLIIVKVNSEKIKNELL